MPVGQPILSAGASGGLLILGWIANSDFGTSEAPVAGSSW